MSAVVGRRNNWLLSPGKFPDQFLFVIDKNKKLFSSTGQEHRKGRKKKGRRRRKAQAQKANEGRRKMEAASEGQREPGVSPDVTDEGLLSQCRVSVCVCVPACVQTAKKNKTYNISIKISENN